MKLTIRGFDISHSTAAKREKQLTLIQLEAQIIQTESQALEHNGDGARRQLGALQRQYQSIQLDEAKRIW